MSAYIVLLNVVTLLREDASNGCGKYETGVGAIVTGLEEGPGETPWRTFTVVWNAFAGTEAGG
jgi:hypothetical protein